MLISYWTPTGCEHLMPPSKPLPHTAASHTPPAARPDGRDDFFPPEEEPCSRSPSSIPAVHVQRPRLSQPTDGHLLSPATSGIRTEQMF